MSTAQPPVFVDDTGRRRILTRRAGRVIVVGFTAYIGLVVLGFARDPRVGPVHLPTFGLSSLALMTPPAPSGESNAAPGHQPEGKAPLPDGASAGNSTAEQATPAAVKPPASAQGGRPATPGTSSTTAPSSTSSPTMSAPSTSTTSSTTTTSTMPGQGQGQGQGAGSSSTKGPDGSGPPGQQRKTTTTTAG